METIGEADHIRMLSIMTHPKQNNRKGEDHLTEFAALAGSTGNAAIGKPHAVRAYIMDASAIYSHRDLSVDVL